MDLRWTKEAKNDLKDIDPAVRKRILKKLSWFAENFEHFTPRPLSGKFEGCYKFRVGDWRVIYTMQDSSIVIQYVGHRSDIYDV